MSDKIREVIEELEAVRLELFRSAASLDNAITDLELVENDPAGPEFIKAFMKERALHRKGIVYICGWNELNEKENAIWQKLLDIV